MTTETSIVNCISGGNVNTAVNKGNTRNTSSVLSYDQQRCSSKIENLQLHDECKNSTNTSVFKRLGKRILNWIFCGPCRTSPGFRKMILTSITLLVTLLLVASPILFLISTAPSIPHHHTQTDDECNSQSECLISSIHVPECSEEICVKTAKAITSKINWTTDVCNDFKSFCCSESAEFSSDFKNPQEIVDHQMLQLLTHNVSSGSFRKLGRLVDSCLRAELNSSTIRLIVEQLGGFLPVNAIGPSNPISPLLSKMATYGAPLPLIDIYFDLSYGRRPKILLILDIPMDVNRILQNPLRWETPKAPSFLIDDKLPKLFDKIVNFLLPKNLSEELKESEMHKMKSFITKFNNIRKEYARYNRDFSNSYVINNVSILLEAHPFINWLDLIPSSWNGPIVLRSSKYLEKLRDLLSFYQNRIVHNSLITLFILRALPDGEPSPMVCARATMSVMPEPCSLLYLSQFSGSEIRNVISRANTVFDLLKSNLKRAPSLRGAALIRLASLKMQAEPWPLFYNETAVLSRLNELEITSDNWLLNVLSIYKQRKVEQIAENFTIKDVETTWAYPIISRAFYNTLSHKIVVPLSLILSPFFDANLPPYLHFSTVGTTISKEILRSVTKAFEEKALKCVPASVSIFSNYSRMELLIASGGFQIAYHSMLSTSGSKAMQKLPGLNLTSTQTFFLVTAQEFCSNSHYDGVETDSIDFHDILLWLFAQGGIASQHFDCKYNTAFRVTQNCGIW